MRPSRVQTLESVSLCVHQGYSCCPLSPVALELPPAKGLTAAQGGIKTEFFDRDSYLKPLSLTHLDILHLEWCCGEQRVVDQLFQPSTLVKSRGSVFERSS